MEEIKIDEVTLEDQPKKSKTTIFAVLLILLLGISFFLFNNKPKVENVVIPNPTVTAQGEVKEFVVTGSNYKFDTSEIKVKVGDTVKITFKNLEGMHDWVIDEFNARTKVIKEGEEESITFSVGKAGTFEYYCSVMQHRKNGMVGKLVVE